MISQVIGDVIHGAAVNGRASASVDVLMTAYNSAATIVDSARSILNQTFRDLRLIVVDDGSTDATASLLVELAREGADARQCRNRGGSQRRASALHCRPSGADGFRRSGIPGSD